MFSKFSATYPKPESNVGHFEQKDDPERLCIFEIRDCKRCV